VYTVQDYQYTILHCCSSATGMFILECMHGSNSVKLVVIMVKNISPDNWSYSQNHSEVVWE